MSDINLEKRMLTYQSTGSGPTWLPEDHLGIKFKFEKDRGVGRQNIINMTKEVVNYLRFLTAGLPVENTAVWDSVTGSPGDRDSGISGAAPGFGVQPCNTDTYVDCFNKKEAAILYFLAGGVAGLNVEQIVDAKIASGRIMEIQKAERLRALNPTVDDLEKVGDSYGPLKNGPLPILYCLCWPLGSTAPLRLTPVTVDEINGFSAVPKGDAAYKRSQIWSKIDFPRFPDIVNYMCGWDALKYKSISQFPIDCFGHDVMESLFYANDLFGEYCEYLKDQTMSFDKFERGIPGELPRGPGGGLIPLDCLGPNSACPEWKQLGYASMDDWIERVVIPEQAQNLSTYEVGIVNTYNIYNEFNAVFNSHYLDYDTNPEFMPTYEQLPRWMFSNACQDQLKFMKFYFLNTALYMTRESYNYLVSILVIARGNGFTEDLFKLKLPAGSYPGVVLVTGAAFNTEPTWANAVACALGTLRRERDVPGDPPYDPSSSDAKDGTDRRNNARYGIVKELIKTWYLLPESYFNEKNERVIPTEAEIVTYFDKITTIYELAALNIARFDAQANTTDVTLQNCLATKKTFEGIGMTKTQLDSYKKNVQKIFTFDWDGYAIEKYKTEMAQFNDRVRDLDWIRDHPVEAWFRDVFAPVGVIVMDFVCKAAPLVIMIIGFTMTPLAGALASAAFATIEGTWMTLAPAGSAFYNPDQPRGWEAFKMISEHVALQVGSDVAGQVGGAIFEGMLNVAMRGAAALSSRIGRYFKNLPEELAQGSKLLVAAERFAAEDAKYLTYLRALEKNVEELEKLSSEAAALEETLYNTAVRNAAVGADPEEVARAARAGASAEVANIQREAADAFLNAQMDLVKYLEKLESEGRGLPAILGRLRGAEQGYRDATEAYEAAEAAANVAQGTDRYGAALDNLMKEMESMQAATDALVTEARFAGMAAYLAQKSPDLANLFTAENILLKGVKTFLSQINSHTVSATTHNWVKDGIVSLYGFEEVASSWMGLIQFLIHWHVNGAVLAQPVPRAGEDYPTLDTNIELPKLQIEMQRIRFYYLTPYINAYARHMIVVDAYEAIKKKQLQVCVDHVWGTGTKEECERNRLLQIEEILTPLEATLSVTEKQLWDTLDAYFKQIQKVFNEYPSDSEIMDKLPNISVPPPPPPPPSEPLPAPKLEKCDGNWIEVIAPKNVEHFMLATFNIELHYGEFYKKDPKVRWYYDRKDGPLIGETNGNQALQFAFPYRLGDARRLEDVLVPYGITRIWANALTNNVDTTCNSLWAAAYFVMGPRKTFILPHEPSMKCDNGQYVLLQNPTTDAGKRFKFTAEVHLNDKEKFNPNGFNWFLRGSNYPLNRLIDTMTVDKTTQSSSIEYGNSYDGELDGMITVKYDGADGCGTLYDTAKIIAPMMPGPLR